MSALAKQVGRLEISQSRGLMAVSLGRSEHALPDLVLVLHSARKRVVVVDADFIAALHIT